MARDRNQRAFKSRYVFPVESPPILDGIVVVESGRIVSVGDVAPDCEVEDLGKVAICPGLVNVHTHLEFSDLVSPLGTTGMSLPDWIRLVVKKRIDEAADKASAQDRRSNNVTAGLKQSTAAGTILLGEIATPGWPSEPFRETEIEGTVFLELLGRDVEQIETLRRYATDHLSLKSDAIGTWMPGLSPHAPYSISLDLLRDAVELSAQKEVPLAMHLAESLEELELLASSSGPFRQLLEDLNAWDPAAIPRGITPLDYLQILSAAHRVLVIHGNYLTTAEIQFIAQHSERMSVAYCPRTHAFFEHGSYPLLSMIEAGVNVAIGTDSRASNPDLSIWREMRTVAETHSQIPLATILELGTLAGARALGVDDQFGSLLPGKRAALAAVSLPDDGCGDPHEDLFRSPLGGPRLIDC